MSRQKVILDVDTGTDDAIAIMVAALHPAIELIGCTTVSGNIEVQFCTDNSLRVLDHIGRRQVRVYEGAARPLLRSDQPIPRRDNILLRTLHGKTLPLPAPRQAKASVGAVEYIVETYRAATDPVTLIAVAPLTNIAAALRAEPRLVEMVSDLRIMGGGRHIGNITAAAEFNIWADPEAAAEVFAAGFQRLTLVPIDATHQAPISRDDCFVLEALGTAAGLAASSLLHARIRGQDEAQPMARGGATAVHDALCVATVIDPKVVVTQRLHVTVETQEALTLGRTAMDIRGMTPPNCNVALQVDRPRFLSVLIEAFSQVAPGEQGDVRFAEIVS